MKENITQKENIEETVKDFSKNPSPKQSTLDFIMQFARVCTPLPTLPTGLNVISAN